MDGRGYDYILQRPQLGRLSRLPFPSICKVARPLFPNSLPGRPHNCECTPLFPLLRPCVPRRNIPSLCSLLFRSHSFDTIRDRCHQKNCSSKIQGIHHTAFEDESLSPGGTLIVLTNSRTTLQFWSSTLWLARLHTVECQVCKGRRWLRLANWGLPAQSNPTSERGFIATAKNGELLSLHGMEKFNGETKRDGGRVK